MKVIEVKDSQDCSVFPFLDFLYKAFFAEFQLFQVQLCDFVSQLSVMGTKMRQQSRYEIQG